MEKKWLSLPMLLVVAVGPASGALAADLGIPEPQPYNEPRTTYNWSGLYFGGSVGVSKSNNNNASVTYQNGTGRGWNNGMFSTDAVTNDFYNTLRSADWGSDYEHNGNSAQASGSLLGTSLATNPLTPWPTDFSISDLNGLASLRGGFNLQWGSFVMGAEVDGSLMKQVLQQNHSISESASLNTSSNQSWSVTAGGGGTGSSTEYGYECQASGVQTEQCQYGTTYSSNYTQNGSFSYEGSIDGLMTVRGRAGFAVGRALFYGTGGLAVGQVKMATHAHASENSHSNWSGTASGGEFTDGTIATDAGSSSSSANTSWSNSSTSTEYGYAVGGGFSYAVTDNIIWTTDGYYYDLGEHSITAVDSAGSGSSITVSQKFDGYVARTGLEWKF